MTEDRTLQDMAELEDDRPLAVRRKRRISTGLVGPTYAPSVPKTECGTEQQTLGVKTPTKAKKRVRFSDPGPEHASSSSSSTGLTPHLKQASFSPNVRDTSPCRRKLPAATPRRLSLPAQLDTSLPSPSLSPSPATASGEMQFEPLRQVLDGRLRRRLRRNGLSEEVNDIEADRREKHKCNKEIQDLKDQLALVKEKGNEEHSDHGETNASADKVGKLEQQLEDLRRELRERSTTAEPSEVRNDRSNEIEIFVDNNEDDPIQPAVSDDEGLRDIDLVETTATFKEASTQISLTAPIHTESLREARLSLEYLFPGEITLGLVPRDPKPLLDVMLKRMQDLKAQVLVSEDSLSRTQAQEANLRNQFNAVLAQLDRARTHAVTIHEKNTKEKSRADTSQARVQMLENTIHAAARKVEDMEKETKEKDQSIRKLSDALESYRVEVGKLESLITKMEGEQKIALSSLQAEMDEAVADLECHVVAETRGRREAEQAAVERDEKINQLRRQEEELKAALSEKQLIIRETERIFEEERAGREREVGGLNVHIGQLSTELSESNAKVMIAEDKQRVLMRKLQEERDAGLQAIEAVQAELARCKEKAEDVQTNYVSDVQRRGAEVSQNQGLLTPVSATRFKDVEGYVEVRRGKGKQKRDSGIVILEEDEDTIMADDL